MHKIRFSTLQIIVHLFSILPLVVLFLDFFNNRLTYNPLQEATLRTGKTAMVLLLLSLTCTPLNTIFGLHQSIKIRRPLGLYAFFYATIHLLIFIGIDYGFQLQFILADLVDKPYILVGLAAFIILFVLSITSTIGWQKRLRKGWVFIHRFVYLSGVLVITHYILIAKSDIWEPLIYGLVLLLLLVLRIPAVHRNLSWVNIHSSINKQDHPPQKNSKVN